MNSETLLIIDSALRNSLLAFLGFFILTSSYAFYRLRVRKRKLADFLDEIPGERKTAEPEEEERFEIQPNRLKTIFHSFLLSSGLALICFLILSFAPLPFVHNFASGTSWQKTPLRVTQLTLDRFHEGFEIEGEVWNQTDESIDGLQVVITIWDHEHNPLDRLTVDVKPSPLPAGRPGTFKLRYTENSPFLSGYQLEFLDSQGVLIPHIEGFNVR